MLKALGRLVQAALLHNRLARGHRTTESNMTFNTNLTACLHNSSVRLLSNHTEDSSALNTGALFPNNPLYIQIAKVNSFHSCEALISQLRLAFPRVYFKCLNKWSRR